MPDTYFVEIENGDEYLQDFNSIGTSATATLPLGWKIEKRLDAPRTLGTFSTASLQTEQVGGNSLSTSTPNGTYNFGAGVANSAADRAIGGVSTSIANGTRCVNIYLKVKNTGNSNIKSLDIEYDVEKYRKGTNAAGFAMQMYYSTDGNTWTTAGDNFKTLFNADSEAGGYTNAPGESRHVSNNLLQNIKGGEYLYLAWNYSVASGTEAQAAQALSIDNVKIKTSETEIEDFASMDGFSVYNQDFSSIGTSATATLPLGWKIEKRLDAPRKLGSFASASFQTEQIGGNSISASTPNGIYNFGAGVAASATDRAIGGVSTGIANGTRCVNIYLKIRNTGNVAINSLDIRYNVEKYRKGANAAGFMFQMYYSTDGETWTSAGDDFKTLFNADTETAGYTTAPGETRNVSENLPLNLDAGKDLFLAWNYSVASGTDAQGAQALAIDNVEIKANNTTVSLNSDIEDDIFLSFKNHQLKVSGEGAKNITLYNINGLKIGVLELNNTYDMSSFNSGIYLIKVNDRVYKIIN